MIPSWVGQIAAACPLEIRSIDWQDPQLTIGGDNWYFNTVTPWRILASTGVLLLGSGDEGFETGLRGLIGKSVVDCLPASLGAKIDSCFRLSDGTSLEVFSDCALEPWTMRLPVPPQLVASPTDPSWLL